MSGCEAGWWGILVVYEFEIFLIATVAAGFAWAAAKVGKETAETIRRILDIP